MARRKVAPYVGPQLAEAIGIDVPVTDPLPATKNNFETGTIMKALSCLTSIPPARCLRALVIIGSLLATELLALDSSERVFIWNEAQAGMAAARTAPDYLRAAQTYQKLVDSGVRNGALFYNLGTALLQSGELEPAIRAFERAERYSGAQHDLRHNLKIALARQADSETVPWPWYRLVLFWHFDLSAATRLMVSALAFSIFWVALTLRLLRIGQSAARAVLILATVALILFGSSVATSCHQEATLSGYQLKPTPTARK